MKRTIFTGAATALITPFKDGYVDFSAYGAIIEEQISSGIDALVVCGTTGESSTLNDDEHREVIEFAVSKVAGRVPVIAGTGSNDTEYAVSLSRHACEEGVDAVLLVTPYYNKATQKGLIKSFSHIADACTKPVILYNVPSRTGIGFKPETYAALADHGNIAAIKEANGDISSIAQTAALCGDRLDIYSGNDDQIVPLMSLGAKGVISVLSNLLPAETHRICAEFFAGNIAESRRLQLYYLDLINALFCEVNPIPAKTAMHLMGKCDIEMRLPLCEMEDKNLERLKTAMRAHGLIS
ncbi:MAG: 4-hydroxy-tetrahydrodipicolinate synthase [Oscillospiraceae bacterium]|nr:4-hydroxy-tetrahydrodipicolinate synthase [Oscillospiraceae bacterium]